MRVLMVSDRYWPALGGLEAHVRALSHALAARGHELTVATLADPALPEREQDGNVCVRRLDAWTAAVLNPLYRDPGRRFHPPLADRRFARGLAELVEAEQPEIVHAHGWSLYSALVLERPPLVATLHDFSLVCARMTYLQNDHACSGPRLGKCLACSWRGYGGPRGPLLAAALRASRHRHGRLDGVIAVSEAVASAALAFGALGRAQLEVIPSFLADDEPAAERPSFLPAEDGYLLFVGALGPHKGLEVLLEAYAGLGKRRPPLVLIGTRRHDTPASFPEGVLVAEDVPHDQVLRAWQGASIGVVPSLCVEGFGIVALEAMAAGLPLVVSATGALLELVEHEKSGIFVPPGNAEALRDTLESLLADPGRRAALGAGARSRASGYTAVAVAANVERFYARLLGVGSPPRQAAAAPG